MRAKTRLVVDQHDAAFHFVDPVGLNLQEQWTDRDSRSLFALSDSKRTALQLRVQPLEKQSSQAFALKPDVSRAPALRGRRESFERRVNRTGEPAIALLTTECSEFS